MAIPVDLLTAISASGGGQVALVLGAGCSFEAPTSMPLAWKCATDAHRKLVDNGVLADGECDDPSDLSKLADLVKSKNDDKQERLVQCLPYKEFKTAAANEGHKIAAALLLEGAVTNIVTLNYDLSMTNAISWVKGGDKISVINGPAQHNQLGNKNLIYLHRSAENDPEDWILTTDALDSGWKDAWEETIARSVIAVPVTVFAGMGSSCGVLQHSAAKLRSGIGDQAKMFLADPGDPDGSKFAKEVKISPDEYVQLGWVAFMKELGARYHKEVVAELHSTCVEYAKREQLVDGETRQPEENIEGLTKRVLQLGILGFGQFRGAVLLDCSPFPQLEESHAYSLADLLLAVGFIERKTEAEAEFQNDGHVKFSSKNSSEISVALIDGSSKSLRWLTLENQITQHESAMAQSGGKKSRRVMATGVTGTTPENATPPQSIVGNADSDDIIDGDNSFQFWDVDQLRRDATSLERLFA